MRKTKILWFWVYTFVLSTAASIEAMPWHSHADFEDDPCAWAMAHGSALYNVVASTESNLELALDILERNEQLRPFANTADYLAKKTLGLPINSTPPKEVLWGNISQVDRQRHLEGRPDDPLMALIPKRIRYSVTELNLEEEAFPMLLQDLINLRVGELRYDADMNHPHRDIFFKGTEAKQILLLGDLPDTMQAAIARHFDKSRSLKSFPWVALASEDAPPGRILRSYDPFIRRSLSYEFNIFANGDTLAFNTDTLWFAGLVAVSYPALTAFSPHAYPITTALESALQFRTEVTLVVDLKTLYDPFSRKQAIEEHKFSIEEAELFARFDIALPTAATTLNKTTQEIPQHFCESLENIAFALTEQMELDSSVQIQRPTEPFDLNYTFTFQTGDEKQVHVKFLGPKNAFTHAEQAIGTN